MNFIQLSRIHFDDDIPKCITICKHLNDNYDVIWIAADNSIYDERPKRYFEGWNRTQPNLSPKSEELYEISEDSILNEICMLIRKKY